MKPELRSYFETALASSSDEPGPVPFGAEDFSGAAVHQAMRDLRRFFQGALELAEIDGDELDASLADVAADFWLARNSMGGFITRPEKYGRRLARRLSALAHEFEPKSVYEMDGELHFA